MTELKIISRMWSHITDLRTYINRMGLKTIDQIESEIKITEMHCLPYANETE